MSTITEHSVTIQAGVIHGIIKTRFSTDIDDSTVLIRDRLHTKNEQVEEFVEYAEGVLAKGSNRSISLGFIADHSLSKILATQNFSFSSDEDYLKVSQELTHGLFHFVIQKSATTSGHIPIIFYKKNGRDYLLLSLISLSVHRSINGETGEFINTNVLDYDAVKVGLSVDLRAMREHYENPNNYQGSSYVRWIERRNRKLPDYVQGFIPVAQHIDDKKSTEDVIKKTSKFIDETFHNPLQAAEVKARILGEMQRCSDNKEPVDVMEDIAPIIDAAMKTAGLEDCLSFTDYCIANHIEVNNSFIPDESVLKRNQRVKLDLGSTSIQGNMGDLGREIQIDKVGEQHYIKAEIDKESAVRLLDRYPQLKPQTEQ
ncbi:nucleoid-associated protein [Stenoxybacter acetivorans]|uniref:nucleoid-associated protein n=1 Tax=Stenoxybacter acetivorans TaxID=422441 RepID=UPI0005675CC7|nr:nucleoid-associated protein [Stenoxybacter acetivorans]